VSFRLSAGTLETMAGVFAPSRKRRAGSGGGRGGKRDGGGAMLGFAVASMFSKPAAGATGYSPPLAIKQAFGGGGQSAASGRAISTMDRTARRAPEVMVRITGRQHGGGHVLANFAYISRLGHGADKELGLYTSDGEVIRDGRAMQDLAQDWQEWEMGGDARRKGATSLSMILSMPSGTDPDRLKAAALDFAREEFANRSWVASLHVDRDHPHVHLTFARRDLDGRRFHPDRDDLFRYRQRFAQKLRDRGIEANATPAKARGIDAKHEHIAATKVRAKGGHPRIDQTRAARALLLEKGGRADPVSSHLRQRQAVVRDAYERSIAELRASPSIVNQTVANSLQRFIDGMGEPEPNSIRALRSLHRSRADDDRAAPTAPAEKGEVGETLADALARSRGMRERIQARRAQDASVPLAAREQPDRERSANELGGRSPSADQTESPVVREAVAVDDLVRAVLDRNQAQRDRDRKRDRNPDKGGPGR
jgi:hypothetical protein